jgi:hypothetical protein
MPLVSILAIDPFSSSLPDSMDFLLLPSYVQWAFSLPSRFIAALNGLPRSQLQSVPSFRTSEPLPEHSSLVPWPSPLTMALHDRIIISVPVSIDHGTAPSMLIGYQVVWLIVDCFTGTLRLIVPTCGADHHCCHHTAQSLHSVDCRGAFVRSSRLQRCVRSVRSKQRCVRSGGVLEAFVGSRGGFESFVPSCFGCFVTCLPCHQ